MYDPEMGRLLGTVDEAESPRRTTIPLIREYFDRVASASGSGGAGGSGSSGGSSAVAASDSAAGRPLKRRRRAKLVAAKATAEAPINVDDAADDAVIDLT